MYVVSVILETGGLYKGMHSVPLFNQLVGEYYLCIHAEGMGINILKTFVQ